MAMGWMDLVTDLQYTSMGGYGWSRDFDASQDFWISFDARRSALPSFDVASSVYTAEEE